MLQRFVINIYKHEVIGYFTYVFPLLHYIIVEHIKRTSLDTLYITVLWICQIA